mgnify:FL=1
MTKAELSEKQINSIYAAMKRSKPTEKLNGIANFIKLKSIMARTISNCTQKIRLDEWETVLDYTGVIQINNNTLELNYIIYAFLESYYNYQEFTPPRQVPFSHEWKYFVP